MMVAIAPSVFPVPLLAAPKLRMLANSSVELTEGSNGELHQKLIKGTVDLVMAHFPENLPGIRLSVWETAELSDQEIDGCCQNKYSY